MFISREFKKLLDDYRKYEGHRIYAIYDTMPQHERRMDKTRGVSEMLKVRLKKAQRAIVWGLEKRHMQNVVDAPPQAKAA